MSPKTIQWNEAIVCHVIETYSRPFDMILNSLMDSRLANQIGENMLRRTDPQLKVNNVYKFIYSTPNDLYNLICLDSNLIINMDMSHQHEFLSEILRILLPNGYCTVLISDEVRHGKIIPNGFQIVHRFLSNKFKIKTILDQHSSQVLPFKLAPHQYLAVFQKPVDIKKKVFKHQTVSLKTSVI